MTRLILAIESDRSKESQLQAIARQAGAEMLRVRTVDDALAAISNRMPDLILTPALLSAREDSRLTERLRGLGHAAAHVQALTIPILEDEATRSPGSGIFGTLRSDKGRVTGPDACEAQTFAEQVGIYLERAAEERQKYSPRPVPAATKLAQPPPPPDHPVEQAPAGSPTSPERADAPPLHQPLRDVKATAVPTVPDFSDLEVLISEELLTIEPAPVPNRLIAIADVTEILPSIDDTPPTADELSDTASRNPVDTGSTDRGNVDRWRFFDATHPRFAALVERLDEIAGRPT